MNFILSERLRIDGQVGQPDGSIGKDRHPQLRRSLHVGWEGDESLGPISADLCNRRIGLFQKNRIRDPIQRVDEDNLVWATLVGQENGVTSRIGGGGEERKLRFWAIIPVSGLCDVERVEPVEAKIARSLREVQR